MSEFSSEKSGVSPERSRVAMNAEAETRNLFAEIAPFRPGDNIKSFLANVAKLSGIGERRIRGIWHGEARAIRVTEMAALFKAARERRAVEEAKNEYRLLDERLGAIEKALGLAPTDVARPQGDASRLLDRPMDRTGVN